MLVGDVLSHPTTTVCWYTVAARKIDHTSQDERLMSEIGFGEVQDVLI
jgi:hypothetical protein